MTGSAIAKALVALQAELPTVRKDQRADAGNFSYSYASLPVVTTALMPVLAKHGLAFSAAPRRTEHGYALVGILLHESGESIEGEYPLPPGGTPQQIGSAITYGRRYLLSALTGLAADDDDDGQAASRPAERLKSTPESDPWYSTAPEPKTASEKQLALLHALFDRVGVPRENREGRLLYVSDVIGRPVTSSGELTVAEASKVLDSLKSDLAGQQEQEADR